MVDTHETSPTAFTAGRWQPNGLDLLSTTKADSIFAKVDLSHVKLFRA